MSDDTVVSSAPAAAPAPAKRAYVRLTDHIKSESTVLYKAGNMDVKDIAARFGISPQTLGAFFRKNKIKKGVDAPALAAKRAAVVEEAMVLDPLVHARRVYDTKNETYRITEMLRKLVAGAIVKCRQDERPLGTIANDIKTIREAAAAIKTCREEAFAVLGIRPEDQGDEALPELVVTDLTEDDITDLQAMPTEKDMGSAIEIEPGADDDNDIVEG